MILFLDFDGVLHPDFARNHACFSANPLLWQLLDACPNVDVVFSTSWRGIHPVAELIQFATQGGGERHARRFLGTTPSLVTERSANIVQRYLREEEIACWLHGNGRDREPWLALDDFKEYFSPACPNLFAVDHITGLTAAHMPDLLARCQPTYQIAHIPDLYEPPLVEATLADMDPALRDRIAHLCMIAKCIEQDQHFADEAAALVRTLTHRRERQQAAIVIQGDRATPDELKACIDGKRLEGRYNWLLAALT